MSRGVTSSQTASQQLDRGKVVAVVSGKGGSGKTMIAVALAQGAALAGEQVVLVDADFATGGLTYYLTFREFSNARFGLSDVIGQDTARRPLSDWASLGVYDDAEHEWMSRLRLVPIGDQRRLGANLSAGHLGVFRDLIAEAASLGSIVIVDCRGGIDSDSVAVCSMSDEVAVVIETDATSIRASQHLIDILTERNLSSKIAGFILNKVMDDPTSIVKMIGPLLGVPYLGSIPFDIEATRSYIQGYIPDKRTLFCRHAFAALPHIKRSISIFSKKGELLSPEEFGTVTLKSPEVRIGGLMILVAGLNLMLGYFYLIYDAARREIGFPKYMDIGVVSALIVLLIFSLSDSVKQSIGRIFRVYTPLRSKYFGGRRRRS